MRHAVAGGALTVALVVGLLIGWMCTSSADAQRPVRDPVTHPVIDQQVVALTDDVDDRLVQVTIIDPSTRALVVYHIDKPSGEVTLRSVRNFHWDMQMDEFNGKHPLPKEIRSLLQSR